MGSAKEAYYGDEGRSDFVQELVDRNKIEDIALGVAKAFLSQGFDALSKKQQRVFDKYVIGPYEGMKCDRCMNEIPWGEIYSALDNGGLCSWCEHMRVKMEYE